MDRLFFDACICIGPRRGKHPAQPWTLSYVLDEMRHCSVAGGLVCHQLGVNYDPMTGNRMLSRDLAPHRHLYAMWNVMPHHTGEFPPPAELLTLMQQANVRAVTLNPKTNGWDLLSVQNAPLLKALAQARILAVIRRDQLRDFGELENLLTQYPRLPVLLAHASWAEQRLVVPLLKAYQRLYLAFSHYQAHYGLEVLVEQGLADQLVYGSNAPEMSMGAQRTYIDYAELPDAVKDKIAGGNLRRLLGGVGPDSVTVNPDEDELMRRARQGQPQAVTLLDMHIHMLHEGLNGGGGAYTMYRGGPAGTLRLMKRLGYAGAAVMSWSLVSGDTVGGNEVIKQALQSFPAGYWGAASFDPAHYSQDDLQRLIPALYADHRFIGMKPYLFGIRYDSPMYDCWWRYGNANRLYALIHRPANDCGEVANLADRYPEVSWIIAHSGASYEVADSVIACARKHRNVYAEITLTPLTAGVIEYLVAGMGADRVLYGSDLPMRDPRQQLGWVLYARLSPEVKAKVLGLNALNILKRSGRYPRSA